LAALDRRAHLELNSAVSRLVIEIISPVRRRGPTTREAFRFASAATVNEATQAR
jgi:hypothetical protein